MEAKVPQIVSYEIIWENELHDPPKNPLIKFNS